MEYLVCRLDAIRPNGRMRSSEYFPMIVETNSTDPEVIVRQALNTINRNYVGLHEYFITPMHMAQVVSFKPRNDYNVEVRDFLPVQ